MLILRPAGYAALENRIEDRSCPFSIRSTGVCHLALIKGWMPAFRGHDAKGNRPTTRG